MKQAVPALGGAVHLKGNRFINNGSVGVGSSPSALGRSFSSGQRVFGEKKLTTETNFGDVTALELEGSYLQALWNNGMGRVSYRYYREDEITRAYQDELVYGSDTVTVGLSHRAKLAEQEVTLTPSFARSVSYTHLTLPTICSV